MIPTEAPALWGISQVATAAGPQSCPLSFADFAADVASARASLATLGVTAGSSVLYTSLMSEAALYTPFFDATWELRAVVSCADATAPDAYRVPLLTAALPRVAAVLGINAAILEGLAAAGVDLAATLASVPVVGARPDALAGLIGAGVPALLWAQVGPMLAVECPARAGAHVPAAWSAAADDGGVVVRARSPRACGDRPWRVAVALTVVEGSCACGRTGQRLQPSIDR